MKRRCLICSRPTGGRHRLCRSCHAEVEVKVEDVALRSGRVLRLCAYQNGHSRRIIVSLLDHTESVAGYVAGFDAEQAPSVRAALERLERAG